MRKCIYCKEGIVDDRAVDVCDGCGVGVWGQKMFQAIKDNMGDAKEKGDLYQGEVGKRMIKDENNFNSKSELTSL